MTDKTYEATLTSPMQWEAWDAEFRTKAIDMALWDYIDPLQEGHGLLTRPTEPQFQDFPLATTPESTPSDSATEGSARRSQRGSQRGSHTSQQPPLRASTYMDLSSDHQRSFQFLINTFNHQMTRYEAQRNHIKDLHAWILKTVNPQYRKTSCIPTES